MKKLMVAIVLLAGVGGLAYLASNWQIEISALTGKWEPVTRGDLSVPIRATGVIEPAQTVEIKSVASGGVEKVYFEPGDMVKKGDLLVALDPIDEQRRATIAHAEFQTAEANLEKANITLRDRKMSIPIAVDSAQAQLDSAQARLATAQLKYDKRETQVRESGYQNVSLQELAEYRAGLKDAQAAVDAAQAGLAKANNDHLLIKLAEQDVKLMTAARTRAQTSHEDAKERLNETKILAPVTGMVTRTQSRRFIEEGEVIQGGKTTFTGGTPLMEIADIGSLYVIAKVDEADIGQVLQLAPEEARPGEPISEEAATAKGAGTPVKIIVDAFKDQEFTGEIKRILPEPTGGGAVVTYDVRIKITSDNRKELGGVLGLQAEVEFTTKSVKDVLLVSYDAVKQDPNGEYGVYLAIPNPDGPGRKEQFRACRFGIDDGIHAQVLEGVEEGDPIYTRLPTKTRKQREAEEAEDG